MCLKEEKVTFKQYFYYMAYNVGIPNPNPVYKNCDLEKEL